MGGRLSTDALMKEFSTYQSIGATHMNEMKRLFVGYRESIGWRIDDRSRRANR